MTTLAYDNVYRKPYELVSALSAAGVGYWLAKDPDLFNTPVPVALSVSAGCLLLASWRSVGALRVRRFRRALRKLPVYEIAAADIPHADDWLFLGRGFKWDAEHTQRLYLARLPSNRRLVNPSRLYKWPRRLERRRPQSLLAKVTRQRQWWNPVGPLAPVGGDPVLHAVELDEEDVWQAASERVGHTLVLGTTRVGKTRLAELLITQDIRRGDPVIVWDPKGDTGVLLRMYAEAVRSGRERDFFMFHLGFPEISARYSPLGDFGRTTEVATRTASPLPDAGQAASFKAFAWRYVNVIARTMAALGEKPTYARIYAHATNIDQLAKNYITAWLERNMPRTWRAEFDAAMAAADEDESRGKRRQQNQKQNQRDPETIALYAFYRGQGQRDPIADALALVLANDRSYFEKLVSSLYPLLEKLTTGKMAELISPDYLDLDDPRPIIDWATVIGRRQIVYVGLDSLTDHEVASAVGMAMFADLTSTAGHLYKVGVGYGQGRPEVERRICAHADEFNEIVGNEFLPLVNKAGGAGLQVTAYSQTFHDIEAKIGSAPKAKQIEGNFNSLIMMRVKNRETAEILTTQLLETPIVTTTLTSGVSDTNDLAEFAEFASRNEDRVTTTYVPTLSPADVMRLPKGQAFALIDGGQLHKVRFPMPLQERDLAIPTRWADMLDHMERKYAAYVATTPPSELVVEGTGGGY